ncbi:MAG: LysR family transcriptional regulator [Planctomycetota bacterium]
MELTPLRYFQAVAKVGHITRAAERLGVTQPALSAPLRKLEADVGAELFHRTARGVELTEAGHVFLEHADGAIRRADEGVEAVRELLGLQRGSIRLGGGATAITYLLPPVVAKFRAAHPGIRFYIREAGSAAVAEAVLEGQLDLGIVTLPLPANLPAAADLLSVPIVDDELRLILPADHPLSGRRAFTWRDLDGARTVGFEAGSAVREVIDRAAASHDVRIDVVMELRSIESIKQMVQAGVGVGFISRFALAQDEGLSCHDGKLTRPIALVRSGSKAPSPAAADFERLLRDAARQPQSTETQSHSSPKSIEIHE